MYDHKHTPPGTPAPPYLSFFESVKQQTPTDALTLPEVVDRVRTCPAIKKATEAILEAHRAGILDGFETIDKAPYQNQKTASLPAILPGGKVNTRKAGPDRTIIPSGFVGLDLDENSPQELKAFAKRINAGEFKTVAFSALSVSGKLNGSLAVLIKVHFPASYKSAPKAILKRLGITKATPWEDALQTINEAYYKAFTWLLEKNAGINAGTNGQSIYNVRYLAHDPNAYFNPNATAFSLRELAGVLDEIELAGHEKTAQKVATEIHATDALAFAEAYAKAKGYELQPGQRHKYLNWFAIACNLLGVPREDVYQYAEQRGVLTHKKTNCVDWPYKNYQDSHGIWANKLKENQRHKIITGQKGQKLSHILEPEAILDKLLIAPTGSGKTFLVSLIPGKKIIVAPTVALVENVVEEYDAVPFVGGQRDVDAVRDADFIATTYASFKRLAEALNDLRELYHVVVDESHAFTSSTSANYQLAQLTDVLNEGQTFKSLSLVTGTYLYNHHPYLRELERIEVKLPTYPKTFAFVDAADTLKAAADEIRESVDAGRFPLVLFNNKSDEGRLGTLKALLSDVKGLRFFNSDTKDDSEFKQIIVKGKIPKGITGVITTSVLKEGNNIYNQEHFDVIVVGAFHPSEIQQFSSRPRDPLSVHITVIRSNRRETSLVGFNSPEKATWLEGVTQTACDELNTQDALFDDQYALEFRARQAIKSNPIRFNEDAREYQVDYLALSYQIFSLERTAMNRNDGLMIKALERYGMKYSGAVANEAEQTAHEKAEAKASREAANERKEIEYNAVLDELAAADAPLAVATSEMKGNAHNLTAVQKAVYSRFEQIAKVCPNQTAIIEQMKATGPKKAAYLRLLKRLKIEAMRRDKDYMASNRKFAIVLKAVHSSFTPGERYTSPEIVNRVHAALSLDGSLDLSYLEQKERSDRYLKVARLFFDFERKDTRNEDGKKVNAYQVCTLVFDQLFKDTTKVRVQLRAEKRAAEWVDMF